MEAHQRNVHIQLLWRLQQLVIALLGIAVHAAQAEIVVPDGFVCEVYAPIVDPMNMAFGNDGTVFLGRDNVGSAGDFGDAVKIHRIPADTGVSEEFGATSIPDPDAVAFDAAGAISGVPGSVLVGGGGGLFAVRPDASVEIVFTPQQLLGDVDDMGFDSTGRLVMIAGLDQVKVSSGEAPALLVHVHTSTPVSLAIDQEDRIFLGGLSGTVSIYSGQGDLVWADFLSGLGALPRIRFGAGGAFGTDLYVMTNGGELYRVALDGSKALFGSGFAAGTVMTPGSWIGFGPDGALYVGEFPNDRVLRISVKPISVAIDIKPGSFPNSINLHSAGVVPVAVLSNERFNVVDLDVNTIKFAGALPRKFHYEDVNGDGLTDLVFHLRTQDLVLTMQSNEAKFTGKSRTGEVITGTDSVRIVPTE
jgi:hypothetical protein